MTEKRDTGNLKNGAETSIQKLNFIFEVTLRSQTNENPIFSERIALKYINDLIGREKHITRLIELIKIVEHDWKNGVLDRDLQEIKAIVDEQLDSGKHNKACLLL